MWMRATFFALLLAGAPLAAQSWDALRGLEGHHIKVLDVGVSADSIAVQDGKNRIVMDRTKVKRVQVRSGARRVRNIAIGAAIGVAIGLTIDQTVGTYLRNETGDSGRGITYAAPIVAFGGIGAALSAYRTVYRVR
jgi:hypothetical protein